MLNRLFQNWVYGGFLAGLLLAALLPVMVAGWPEAARLTFACLPIYMVHQYEEHDNDRFRLFVNRTVGHGKEVLTPAAVFIINVPLLWGVVGVCFTLSWTIAPGLGLIPVYLILVNAAVHVASALRSRQYNPGLITAIVLFLPIGSWVLYRFVQIGAGGALWQVIGILFALLTHAAIVVYALARRRRLTV